MKNEIKCPNCGTVFQIDESDYNSIVEQIKNDTFKKELEDKEKVLKEQLNTQVELAKTKAESLYQEELTRKEEELQKTKLLLAQSQNEVEKKLFAESQKSIIAISEKDSLIASLKKELELAENAKESAVKEAVATQNQVLSNKEIELERLKQSLIAKEAENKLAIAEAVNKKEKEISELQSKIVVAVSEHANKETALKNEFAIQLKAKQEEVDFYKDFKAKQSTKSVGESLEIYCSNEFARYHSLFPKAQFGKDNTVSAESGSKGDFIYRDFDEEGNEFISIMFEMKNENNTTATKKTNEHFFKELDKDRKEKKCEYAVLVSMLEPESELYNNGIVDVSHNHERMYVVRPQCFMTIITLLRSAAMNSLEYKKQLSVMRNQNVDISNFEANMNEFKDKFGRNYELASKKFKDAIDDIDKTIKALEKTKADLMSSENNLRLANDKAQDLSIKKLTRNAPSMAKRFEDLNK